jgi:hypothetical protein
MNVLALAGLSFLGLVIVDSGIEFLRQRKARQLESSVMPPDSKLDI